MAARANVFVAILAGAIASAGFSQADQEGAGVRGLTPESYELAKNPKTLRCSAPNPLVGRYAEAGNKARGESRYFADILANPESVKQLRLDAIRRGDFDVLKIEYEGAPFSFLIFTPCARMTEEAERAESRYRKPTFQPMEDLNRDGVLVSVQPARFCEFSEHQAEWDFTDKVSATLWGGSEKVDAFAQADAIERVVIKLGGQIIEPTRQDVRPVTIQNGLGGSRQLTRGDFYFPISAFAPTADFVLVLIGTKKTVEWPITRGELASLR